MFARVLTLLGMTAAAATLWAGLGYYTLPFAERPFSPLYDLYAPSGLVGHGLGILGTLMILAGVLLYSTRKRVGALARVGTLKHWLELHIFLCLLGPYFVLLHTTFKVGGLVAISFWSMVLVVLSGAFGRWVYLWIPKTLNGHFLGVQELEAELASTLDGLGDRPSLPRERILELLGDAPARPEAMGIGSAVLRSLRFRVQRRSDRARLERELRRTGIGDPERSRIVATLERRRRVRQQMVLMRPFQRAFRYWHAFHLPLALVMLLILAVHVGVSVAFGYTWIF